MSVRTFVNLFKAPSRLQWWEWAKLAGCVAMVALLCLLVAGCIPHPAVVAILMHIAADFTCQSPETDAKKSQRGRHLVIHALAAGGTPLAIAGIATADPRTIIVWTAIGVAGHYLVDWMRKFGIRKLAPAVLLDQACHLAVILVATLLWS
jgi:hypothetical protein